MTKKHRPGEVLETKIGRDVYERTNTGILDKATLESLLVGTFTERVLEFCARDGASAEYSVILFDVDYFKAINDLLGHKQGDNVIAEICHELEKYASSREMIGVLGKKGGEEFLIALPYASSRMARYIADEVRELVRNHSFVDVRASRTPLLNTVTISLGVNTVDLAAVVEELKLREGDRCSKVIGDEVGRLIDGADVALSMAKYLGRNTIEPFRQHLAEEKQNLDVVRSFYFRNAWKKPVQMREFLNDAYFVHRKSVRRRMEKHFAFARKELNHRDTRTAALLADNLYRQVSSGRGDEKQLFVEVLRWYS